MKHAALFLAILSANAVASHAANIPVVDVMGDWSQSSTPLGAGPSNNPQITWTLTSDGIETSNGSGSLLSNFTTTGDFSFSVRVRSTTPSFADNDLWGVVFGYQDSSNHYRLGWEAGGYPDQGPGESGSGANGMFLVRQASGSSIVLFNDSDLHWENNMDYDVLVFHNQDRVGFSVSRAADSALMGEGSFASDASVHGKVGVYVDSQTARFSSFDYTPEPSTSVLVILGLLTLAVPPRRRRP